MKGIIRSIPHFKGKFRLVRILKRDFINKSRDIIINGKFGLKYKVPNLKEVIGFEIFADGMYEKETFEFIKSKLPEYGVFVDIGANIGSVTVPICKLLNGVRAICIEASPRVFTYLKENVELNKLNNCLLVNKAISDQDDETVKFYSPEEQFGKGSMSPVFTKQFEKIHTITLDKLTKELNELKIDFIKADIEGYEYYAFKGAKEILTSKTPPDILFEFVDWAEAQAKDLNPGDAQKLLMSYGYKLYIVNVKGKLTYSPAPLLKGSAMLFASKNCF